MGVKVDTISQFLARTGSALAGFRTNAGQQRRVELDLLRGIAILLVMGQHFLGLNPGGKFEPVMQFFRHYGWTGVDLFFVLSGFLVGGLILKEVRQNGRFRIKRFVVRRTFRIWPPYLAFLLVMLLIPILKYLWFAQGSWDAIGSFFWGHWLENLLQLQSYCCVMDHGEHAWSLAVEEHFYILLPLMIFVLLAFAQRFRRAVEWLPVILGMGVILCTTLRFMNFKSAQDFTSYTATHLRLDSLLWGVLLAYLYYFKPRFWAALAQHTAVLFGLGVLFLIPLAFMNFMAPWTNIIGFNFLYLGYGCLLMALVGLECKPQVYQRITRAALVRAIAWVGFFSYSIYLWHYIFGFDTVAFGIEHHLLGSFSPTVTWIIRFVIYLVLGISSGVLLALAIEKPSILLRDRLFPERGTQVAQRANTLTAPAGQ